MTIHGRLRYLDKGAYTVALAPIAQIHHVFRALYNSFISLTWRGLAVRTVTAGKVNVPIALLSMLGVSVAAYYLQEYSYLLVPAAIALWFGDCLWARQRYLNATTIASTSLDISPDQDWVVWQLAKPSAKPQRQRFKTTDIAQVSILNVPFPGGAFDDVLVMLWQVRLILRTGSALHLYEETTAHEALTLAELLANQFSVPIKFAHSEGSNPYAAQLASPEALRHHAQTVNTIQVKKTDYKWQVTYQWNGKNIPLLIGQMFQQAGFLLFLLLMMGILFRVGGAIVILLPFLPKVGDPNALPTLATILQPRLGWLDLVGIFVGMGLLFRRGADLTEPTQLNFGKNSLIVPINKEQTIGFRISEIKTTLVIKKPMPKLIIVAGDQSAELDNLQTEGELRALLSYLDQGMQLFTAKQREPASEELLG